MTTDLALGVLLGVSVAFTLARVYSDLGGDASIDTRGWAWLRRFLHFFHHGDFGLGVVIGMLVLWFCGLWVLSLFWFGLVIGFGTGAAVEDGLYHAIKKFGKGELPPADWTEPAREGATHPLAATALVEGQTWEDAETGTVGGEK